MSCAFDPRPLLSLPVAAGCPPAGLRREAAGLRRGVQELQARLQVLLHGAFPGPGGVDGEASGLHPQRGHLLHRYAPS